MKSLTALWVFHYKKNCITPRVAFRTFYSSGKILESSKRDWFIFSLYSSLYSIAEKSKNHKTYGTIKRKDIKYR